MSSPASPVKVLYVPREKNEREYIIDPVLPVFPNTDRSGYSPAGGYDGFNKMLGIPEETRHIYRQINHVKQHVSDCIELTLQRGLCSNINISGVRGLTDHSRVVVWSDNGLIINYQDYDNWYCPKEIAAHSVQYRELMAVDPDKTKWNTHCVGVHYADLSPVDGHENSKIITREMTGMFGEHSYQQIVRPPGIEPVYAPAIVMAVPINRIIITKPANPSVSRILQRTFRNIVVDYQP